MPPYELKERTRVFALAVVTFCRRLPKTDEAREAARQLRRAANSVRSNYRASRNGRSRDEFASRLAEAHEEARALTRILSASLRTTRINTARMKEIRQTKNLRKA